MEVISRSRRSFRRLLQLSMATVSAAGAHRLRLLTVARRTAKDRRMLEYRTPAPSTPLDGRQTLADIHGGRRRRLRRPRSPVRLRQSCVDLSECGAVRPASKRGSQIQWWRSVVTCSQTKAAVPERLGVRLTRAADPGGVSARRPGRRPSDGPGPGAGAERSRGLYLILY